MWNWRGMLAIWDVNFGRDFFGAPENLKKQNRKIRGQNSLEEFAEEFAGNSLRICQTKIKKNPNPLCRTSESKRPAASKKLIFWFFQTRELCGPFREGHHPPRHWSILLSLLTCYPKASHSRCHPWGGQRVRRGGVLHKPGLGWFIIRPSRVVAVWQPDRELCRQGFCQRLPRRSEQDASLWGPQLWAGLVVWQDVGCSAG